MLLVTKLAPDVQLKVFDQALEMLPTTSHASIVTSSSSTPCSVLTWLALRGLIVLCMATPLDRRCISLSL